MSDVAYSRPILDDIVTSNKNRNLALYSQALAYPPYFGRVNIGMHKVELAGIKTVKSMEKQSLIHAIINTAEMMKLKEGTGIVRLYKNGVLTDVNVDPYLIRFIKACAVCSYSMNEEYSIAVTDFLKEVLDNIDSLYIPIQIRDTSKVQKIVCKELNEYLKKICDETGTKYSEVVKAKKSKSLNELLSDAEG